VQPSASYQTIDVEARVSPELAGMRLDQVAAQLFADFSRSRLKQWIEQGQLLVNGEALRPRDKVFEGDLVRLRTELEDRGETQAEAIPLDIRYQDRHLLILNKPAGLVVHPAAGNWQGTLQNALLHFDPGLAVLPRAGIVHRLDKDTSGLMVVARTPASHRALVEAIQAREVGREYLALVVGVPVAGGTVDAPIGRHPTQRTRMAVVANGKPAVTHYQVLERYRAHSLLHCRLESGRTHQIRVHLSHIGYPLLGDPQYGGRLRLPPDCSDAFASVLRGFRRQALHAWRLRLRHPETGRELSLEAEMPDDFRMLIGAMKQDMEQHGA